MSFTSRLYARWFYVSLSVRDYPDAGFQSDKAHGSETMNEVIFEAGA